MYILKLQFVAVFSVWSILVICVRVIIGSDQFAMAIVSKRAALVSFLCSSGARLCDARRQSSMLSLSPVTRAVNYPSCLLFMNMVLYCMT